MSHIRGVLGDPAHRRLWVTATSGALIVLALGARFLVGSPGGGAVLMTAAAVMAGWDIAVRAWQALRMRHVGIELLVTLAAGGALAIGEYWEAAAVTFLFMTGAWLEARSMHRTRGALRELLNAAPSLAVVLRDGETIEVAPEEVRPEEIVLVKPGQRIPVDGEVIAGAAAVDESSITGEPVPSEKAPGSRVFSGTITYNGLLRIRTTGAGADTTLARIVRRVEDAQEEKAPTQRMIDRFARFYTPAIIAGAAAAFLVTRDVRLSLTLLVVACPGALVISTPVSIIAGIGRAARRGILIKGGQHLESAARVNVLALDKTGTLTEGRPELLDVVVLNRGGLRRDGPPSGVAVAENVAGAVAGIGTATCASLDSRPRPATGSSAHSDEAGEAWKGAEREMVRLAAIAEAGSGHPLGRPIVEAARAHGPVPEPDALDELAGMGVRARHEGREVVVGSRRLLETLNIAVDAEEETLLEELQALGRTPILVAVDGTVAGVLGLGDRLRTSAAPMVAELRAVGVHRLVMLTGDSRGAAAEAARGAGIEEVHAELLPEQKLEQIRRLRADGSHVAMIGDGINDAPALAAADTSIAMGAAGSDVAIETADIALLSDDLEKLPEAIRIARATLRNMRQNLGIALLTVGGLLAGVLGGHIHMAGGMLIHQLSVLAVVANAMRLLGPAATPKGKR